MQLYQGDCLEIMKQIPDKSVDMILCDLPYGIIDCKWDIIIPFDKLWEQYNRIIKDNGAILLFGSEPFSSMLRMSALKIYKYDWVWNKRKVGNPFNGKYMPQKIHETISVFCKKTPLYNPQMIDIKPRKSKMYKNTIKTNKRFKSIDRFYTQKYPQSIIDISNANNANKMHPTQKPVALCEYLIKTYTNENDVVLDNCMGSGTTGVACKHLNRNFIGIELDPNYFEIAKNRIENEPTQLTLTE